MIVNKALTRPILYTLLALILTAESGFAMTRLSPEPEKKDAIPGLKEKSRNKIDDSAYHLMELSYLTLNAIDLATTFHSLDNGAREMNPIARTAAACGTIPPNGAFASSTPPFRPIVSSSSMLSRS